MNLKKIYEYALKREQEGRDFYRHQADHTGHAVAKGIFTRLVTEEEQHIAYIQHLVSDPEHPSLTTRETGSNQDSIFDDRAESEKLNQSVIESMIPDVAILRMAYLIERDFAEFYQMLADKTEGKACLALQKLAAWERQHEALFKELHDRVFEQYTNMPWGG